MYNKIVMVVFILAVLFGGVIPFLISTASDTGVVLGLVLIFAVILAAPKVVKFIKGEK